MDDDRKLILETGQYRVWIGQKGTIFIRILKRTSVKQLMILIGDIYQNNLSDSEKRSVICTLYFPVSLYRENKETNRPIKYDMIRKKVECLDVSGDNCI